MASPVEGRSLQKRARYARTNGNMLVAGSYSSGPGVDPSGQPPIMWWNGSDSGGGLNPIGPNGPWVSTGPAKPVVTRATALITGPLTAAPFKVLELGFGGAPLHRPRWLVDPMLVRPDDRFPTSDIYPAVLRLTRAAFFTEWVRTAIWWGLGGFLYIEGPDGQPLAGSLRNVSPFCLSTERTDDGLCWVIGDPEDSGNQVVADFDGRLNLGPVTYKLCVLRNPHSPIDSEGMSQGVFAMNPDAFCLASQIDTYTSGTFRSGIPAGFLKVLTPGLQQTQADKLKADWLAAHGNDRRSIAVLNAMVEFQALSLSPVDSALGEVKRLNVADVAMAFGEDPMTLGAGLNNSATYTNLRDAWENHRDFGLAPWIAAVEDCLTALLPGTQGVKVSLDGFANPPLSERVATGVAATSGDRPLMTVDEWRELEGLPPLEADPTPPPAAVPDLPAPPAVEPPAPVVRSVPSWQR